MRRAWLSTARSLSLLTTPSPVSAPLLGARALSVSPAALARARRLRLGPVEDQTDFRALAKEQVDQVDRRGFEDFSNVEAAEHIVGKEQMLAGEGAADQLARLEGNREDPDADWFVAGNRDRGVIDAELEKELRKIADEVEGVEGVKELLEAQSEGVEPAATEPSPVFPHDETKGDFIPRWMRNLSVAERRAEGVLLNEDMDEDFEEGDEATPGRKPIVRAETYSDEQLLELLSRENAGNVTVIDVRGKMDGVETIVICEGQTGRQLYRMASRARSTFKYCFPTLPTLHGARDRLRDPISNKVVRAPAGTGADWLVLEFGPTTVHFMLPDARKYYDLEGLWTKQAEDIEGMVRNAERELAEQDDEGAVDLEKRQARRERFEKMAAGKRGGFNVKTSGGRPRRRAGDREGDYEGYIRGDDRGGRGRASEAE